MNWKQYSSRTGGTALETFVKGCSLEEAVKKLQKYRIEVPHDDLNKLFKKTADKPVIEVKEQPQSEAAPQEVAEAQPETPSDPEVPVTEVAPVSSKKKKKA